MPHIKSITTWVNNKPYRGEALVWENGFIQEVPLLCTSGGNWVFFTVAGLRESGLYMAKKGKVWCVPMAPRPLMINEIDVKVVRDANTTY